MKFTAHINVMPLKELLDPQGKTVAKNMKNIGIEGVHDVRIGKHITLDIEATSEAAVKEQVEAACKKILSNVVMESYEYTLETA